MNPIYDVSRIHHLTIQFNKQFLKYFSLDKEADQPSDRSTDCQALPSLENDLDSDDQKASGNGKCQKAGLTPLSLPLSKALNPQLLPWSCLEVSRLHCEIIGQLPGVNLLP